MSFFFSIIIHQFVGVVRHLFWYWCMATSSDTREQTRYLLHDAWVFLEGLLQTTSFFIQFWIRVVACAPTCTHHKSLMIVLLVYAWRRDWECRMDDSESLSLMSPRVLSLRLSEARQDQRIRRKKCSGWCVGPCALTCWELGEAQELGQ